MIGFFCRSSDFVYVWALADGVAAALYCLGAFGKYSLDEALCGEG